MRIGVDCDGPMYPFTRAFSGLVMEEEDRDDCPELASCWDMWEDYGWTLEQWLEAYERWVLRDDRLLCGQPPDENVTAAFERMHEAGHELWVVTALSVGEATATARNQRLRWLGEWGFMPDGVQFCGKRQDKTLIQFDAFVEDHPGTLELILDEYPKTIPLLVDFPHNRWYDETKTGVVRVGSLYDAAVYLGA